MSTYYDEYRNDYYNPDDVEEQPGDNQNWKLIQKGFDTVNTEIDKRKCLYSAYFTNNTEVTVPANGDYDLGFGISSAIPEWVTGIYEIIPTGYVVSGSGDSSADALYFTSPYVVYSYGEGFRSSPVLGTGLLEEGGSANIMIRLINPTNEDFTIPVNGIRIRYRMRPVIY